MAFLMLSSWFFGHCCFSDGTQAWLTPETGNSLISILFQPIESRVVELRFVCSPSIAVHVTPAKPHRPK